MQLSILICIITGAVVVVVVVLLLLLLVCSRRQRQCGRAWFPGIFNICSSPSEEEAGLTDPNQDPSVDYGTSNPLQVPSPPSDPVPETSHATDDRGDSDSGPSSPAEESGSSGEVVHVMTCCLTPSSVAREDGRYGVMVRVLENVVMVPGRLPARAVIRELVSEGAPESASPGEAGQRGTGGILPEKASNQHVPQTSTPQASVPSSSGQPPLDAASPGSNPASPLSSEVVAEVPQSRTQSDDSRSQHDLASSDTTSGVTKSMTKDDDDLDDQDETLKLDGSAETVLDMTGESIVLLDSEDWGEKDGGGEKKGTEQHCRDPASSGIMAKSSPSRVEATAESTSGTHEPFPAGPEEQSGEGAQGPGEEHPGEDSPPSGRSSKSHSPSSYTSLTSQSSVSSFVTADPGSGDETAVQSEDNL